MSKIRIFLKFLTFFLLEITNFFLHLKVFFELKATNLNFLFTFFHKNRSFFEYSVKLLGHALQCFYYWRRNAHTYAQTQTLFIQFQTIVRSLTLTHTHFPALLNKIYYYFSSSFFGYLHETIYSNYAKILIKLTANSSH